VIDNNRTMTDSWRIVATANELPPMSMKHVEVEGLEIALINFDGTYYAIGERCGHMNTPLSMGHLENFQGKEIVRCPLHGSTFDVRTGKNVTGPVKSPPPDLACLAQGVRDGIVRAGELSALIKVYDVGSYEVKREGEDIKLNFSAAKENSLL
jgi:nitrite reductase/ring-hydroxylating ferredoxin subunit